MKQTFKNIIGIIFGSLIFAFGLNYFTITNQLSEGGFTGIALLLNYLFLINPALTILALNIPLFILGLIYLGKKSMFYTVIGTISLSFFIELTKKIPSEPIKDDLLLAALYAGVIIGIGLGIIFRFGGTTGGVDIIARLFNKFFGFSLGKTMFIFDFLVITSSVFVIGRDRAMYTLVSVLVSAKVIDFIQEGLNAAKAAFIISDKPDLIAHKILNDMERGTTILKGKGGYTSIEKEVLYCVVGKNELIKLKNLVKSVDSNAFIVVNNVHDVLGEGFNPLH